MDLTTWGSNNRYTKESLVVVNACTFRRRFAEPRSLTSRFALWRACGGGGGGGGGVGEGTVYGGGEEGAGRMTSRGRTPRPRTKQIAPI